MASKTDTPLDIPPAWNSLDYPAFKGILMVVGAPDVGKSTFARHLFQKICREREAAAFLDGDPGQADLGPPATLTAALSRSARDGFPPQGARWRHFIGSTSPTGHMLPLLVGAARLTDTAMSAGAKAVVYDTNGLIDPDRGGMHLKQAEVNLLRPTTLFCLQRKQELRMLVEPLRRMAHIRVVDLPVSGAVRPRSGAARKARRTANFKNYFLNGHDFSLSWTRFAVFPSPYFHRHQLIAFENSEGHTLGLGIIEEIDTRSREITVFSPIPSLDTVESLRLGNVAVDPRTFEDHHLSKK